MTSLRQRTIDAHALLTSSDTLRELREVKGDHQRRLSELTRHRGLGGHALDDSAPQVIDERKKLARVEVELARLKELDEVRVARWRDAGALEQQLVAWLRTGIPGNCRLVEVEDQPAAELLKKGETVATAVERCRFRLRELQADAHRVRSSPFPSSDAKRKVREQIDTLADAAEPDTTRVVELLEPVAFVTTALRADIHNAGAAVAFSEVPDAIGLIAWLFRDQLIAKVEASIDAVADDKAALSERERQEQEAVILADALVIERQEVALILHAETQGMTMDFRKDTDPRAVLGVRLVTVPRAAGDAMLSPGSSLSHAIDFVGLR